MSLENIHPERYYYYITQHRNVYSATPSIHWTWLSDKEYNQLIALRRSFPGRRRQFDFQLLPLAFLILQKNNKNQTVAIPIS